MLGEFPFDDYLTFGPKATDEGKFNRSPVRIGSFKLSLAFLCVLCLLRVCPMYVSRGPANRIKIPLALVHGGLNIQEQRGTPKLQRLSSRVSGVPSMNNRHLRYARLGTGT